MKNSHLLILAVLLLLLGLIGMNIETEFNRLFTPEKVNFYFAGGQVVLIFLILVNGTYIEKTWQRYGLYASLGLLIIAVLFKLLKFSGANELFVLSFVSPIFMYTPHFLRKSKKTVIDIVKYLWALTFLPGTLFKVLKLPYGDELVWVSYAFLLFLTIDFLIKFLKKPSEEN